jgi:hypothetical protein
MKRVDKENGTFLIVCNIYSINLFFSLCIIVCAYMALNFFTESLVFNKEFYYQVLSDQMSIQSIDQLIGLSKRTWWLGYAFQPIYVVLKTSYFVLCITIYCIVNDIQFDLRDVFKATVFSEIVFVICHVVYFYSLFNNRNILTIETVSDYFPLSLISFLGSENVVSWLHYPL